MTEHENIDPAEMRTAAGDSAQGGSPVRKFHVRRADGNDKSVDLNAEAIKRNLEQNELEKRESAAKEAEIRRALHRSALLKSVVIGVIVLTMLAGCAVWLNRRSVRKRETAAAALAAEEQARARRMAERAEKERELEAQKKRWEEDRVAEQAKRMAQDAERAAKQKAEDAKRAAERAAEQARRSREEDVIKRISKIDSAFDRVRLLPLSVLPKAKRPGAVDGTFLCIIPDAQGVCSYYEVTSHATGTQTVARLSRGQEAADVDFAEWRRRIGDSGGFLCDGSSAYLCLPRLTNDESPYPREDIDPSRMRLGALANVIGTKGMSLERAGFEVRLRVPGVMNSTAVATVKYGESVLYDDVRRKIRDVAAKKVKKQKPRTVRRTIVFYDGSITKRQINGVTLLPRNPRRYTAQYATMRDEAMRQEEECREAEREAVERYDEQVEKKTEDMLNAALFSIVLRVQED